jgi:hypothetical protein
MAERKPVEARRKPQRVTVTGTERKTATVVTTDAEIDAAIARGKLVPSHRVVEATYNAAADRISIRFENGTRLEVPRKLLQGLTDAKPAQLRTIEILGPGTGLNWPALDVAHYVPGLLDGVFGTRQWMNDLPALRARMSELGRLGAGVRTPAKSAASRANGKKGGRPKGSVNKKALVGA